MFLSKSNSADVSCLLSGHF